ncbi:MAG: hypothetical protein ACREN6_05955 [Gemmatimonadaceae bacterium]
MPENIDDILAKLAKDVENAVHSMYRGEMRQHTAQARTGQYVLDAQGKVAEALGAASAAVSGVVPGPAPVATSPRPSVFAPVSAGAAVGWTTEESDAVLKCITAWLPMGGPQSTPPDTLCIAPGKMLIPTWGERERAREAVRKLMQ